MVSSYRHSGSTVLMRLMTIDCVCCEMRIRGYYFGHGPRVSVASINWTLVDIFVLRRVGYRAELIINAPKPHCEQSHGVTPVF